MNMKTELRFVSPAQARAWLECNTDNRPLRKSVVDGLRSAWKRGEWMTTHQGIAFAPDGGLLDGQHRLAFIAQLPEGSLVEMNVTTGMDRKTFSVIDQGARRTLSDVLRVSPQLAAVGVFLAKIHNSSNTMGMSVAYAAPFIDLIRDEFAELVTHCPKCTKTWSSSTFRAAAVLKMHRGGDREFVKRQYAALVNTYIEDMTPAARSILKQQINGTAARTKSTDLFVRGLRVFDRATSAVSRLQINEYAETIKEVRGYLASVVTLREPVNDAARVVVQPAARPRRGDADDARCYA